MSLNRVEEKIKYFVCCSLDTSGLIAIFTSCRIKPDETKQIILSIDPKQATEGDEELKAAGKPVIFQAKSDMEQISNGGFDPSEHLLGLPPAHGEKARNLKEVKFNELCFTCICFYLGFGKSF